MALEELLEQERPAQALDAFKASSLVSNLEAKTSSWTKMSVDLQRDHSSYIGVERNPNCDEQMKQNSSLPHADMPQR